MKIQQLFELSMKRDLPELLDFPPGIVVNLGCGASRIAGAINLDYPQWEAEKYEIKIPNLFTPVSEPISDGSDSWVQCPDNMLAGIHAYHFLEHLHDPRRMLREMQRCLMPGGVINICVPHYSGSMSHHDLDHKHSFAIDTWRNTFGTPYYSKDRDGWQLRVHFNALVGIVERNLAILTQLVKDEDAS